jgi:hypothetical protein
MKRATALLTVALCVASFSVKSSAQNINRTSNAEIPTKSNAPDKQADAASPVKPDDFTEMEKLRHRVNELEEQQRALVLLLKELKTKLELPKAPENSDGTQRSTSAAEVASKPAASASPQNDNGNVRWSDLIGEGNKLKFYGFMRLDLIFDSQQPNNAQTILFIKSPDPRIGNENGDFTMHPRLTRFGIDYLGPRIGKLGDAKLTGKLETDFQNGGSESRQIIRIRHAFLRLDWKEINVLGGQTWDIVSPLFPTVNSDTLQWNAGNIGDRRPQFRAAYEPKVGKGKFSFAGGIGLTGAIDSADLDANGVRDGEESARPNIQARSGFSRPFGSKDRVTSFGVSGFYGFLKTARPVAGLTQFRSQAINVDFTLPFSSWLALKGEGWWGRNMSDVRGGAGQGINLATGRAIRGRGGWTEANLKISRYLSINPGLSTDDPVDADIPTGGRTRNRTLFIANRITPGNNFLIGADYLYWKTDFLGFLSGIDNRVNIFLQYNF